MFSLNMVSIHEVEAALSYLNYACDKLGLTLLVSSNMVSKTNYFHLNTLDTPNLIEDLSKVKKKASQLLHPDVTRNIPIHPELQFDPNTICLASINAAISLVNQFIEESLTLETAIFRITNYRMMQRKDIDPEYILEKKFLKTLIKLVITALKDLEMGSVISVSENEILETQFLRAQLLKLNFSIFNQFLEDFGFEISDSLYPIFENSLHKVKKCLFIFTRWAQSKGNNCIYFV
jgi:hypothetical protein